MDKAKYVTLDGIRTRYFEAGTGDALVLIHGGKFGTFYSAYHWSLNFHELSKHFHVYAFDKLGMGESDNPKSDADYTMAAVIEHTRLYTNSRDFKRYVGRPFQGSSAGGATRGRSPRTS
jgi:2-hydroxy-6-oxonona-2,4-dienedioate hydrolase